MPVTPASSASVTNLRPDLAGLMQEFDAALDTDGFIGYRILRPKDVALQSSPFGKLPIEQILKNPETARGSGGNYNRRTWKFETDNYATSEHGLEGVVDERNARIYEHYVQAEAVTASLVRADVLRNAEKRVADLIFNTSTWTPTAITNEWDDYSNATPIVDVESKVQAIWGASGLWPNAMVMNRKVFRNLRNCSQVIDRISASGAGDKIKPSDITAEMLARVFDLPYIIVGGGAKNTAKEGQAATIASIWSDEYCWIGRVATSDMIEEPCIGRTFHWSADGSAIGGAIDSYLSNEARGNVVRVRHEVHEKIIHSACGGLLSNITT